MQGAQLQRGPPADPRLAPYKRGRGSSFVPVCSSVHHARLACVRAGSRRRIYAMRPQFTCTVTTGRGNPSLRSRRIALSPGMERAARRLSPPTSRACESPDGCCPTCSGSTVTGCPVRRVLRGHQHATGGAGHRARPCRLRLPPACTRSGTRPAREIGQPTRNLEWDTTPRVLSFAQARATTPATPQKKMENGNWENSVMPVLT